jgi:Domain of unknown function DUF29
MTELTTYDTDFYLWTQQQAALLRQRLLSAVDVENLAEEIESMGKSDRRSVESHLFIILTHLLKWQYQPRRRGNSWRLSIRNGRRDVERLLKDSPSLKWQLPDLAIGEYPGARLEAADETGLPLATFPESCPFTIEQVTGDYWPN